MARVLIDATTAQHARGGIGVVTERFLEALAELDVAGNALVLAGPAVAVPPALETWQPPLVARSAARIGFQRLAFPVVQRLHPALRGAERVLFMDSYVPAWGLATGPHEACFVHDVLPLTHPRFFTARKDAAKRVALSAIRRRQPRVFTSSTHTADEIAAALGIEAEVARFGCGQLADAEADRLRGEPPRPPRPYLLYIGAIEARKDLHTLIRGYERAVSGWDEAPRLLIAGDWRTPEGRGLRRWAAVNAPAGVRFIGRPAPGEAIDLMRGAVALVYPSLAEGFGLPVLEGLAAGTRVVASDIPAIASWAGDAVTPFAAGDPASLAEALREVLAAPREARAIARGNALSEGYRWRVFAERLAA